jgi:hypothetical protein
LTDQAGGRFKRVLSGGEENYRWRASIYAAEDFDKGGLRATFAKHRERCAAQSTIA